MLSNLSPEKRERALKFIGLLTDEERAELDRLLIHPDHERIRYHLDPIAFVHEVLRVSHLAPYQREIITALAKHRRACVRGPHGMGKTAVAAMCILWFIAVHQECKIPTTASAWRQLTEFLWPEVHKWALRADWSRLNLTVRPGKELLATKLIFNPNRFAFALSSTDEAKIEGAHAEAILYVFDEAKTIDPAIWDAAEGALSSGQAYALALSTPGDSVGRFYDIQIRKPGYEDWRTIHVTKDECIAAGRMSAEWAEQRKKAWGEQSVMYRRRVLGDFAEDEADTLIKLSWIEAANQRWNDLAGQERALIAEGVPVVEAVERVWGPLTHLGVDPGRLDKSAFAFRHGDHIREVRTYTDRDLMVTTDRIVQACAEQDVVVHIDPIGVGAGVVDRLRQLHRERTFAPQAYRIPLRPINVGVATRMRDKTNELTFATLRDWLYWHLREVLEDGLIALPPDDMLTADLVAPRWTVTSGGRIKVEAKDDLRRRLGRSPDAGDAVMLAMMPDESPFKLCVGFL